MIVEILPAEAENQSDFAEYLFENKKYNEAIRHQKKVIEYRPEEPQGYFDLSKYYKAANKTEEAKKILELMLQKNWEDRFGDVIDKTRAIIKNITN